MKDRPPIITARLGAAWIEARYDDGAMPVAVSLVIRRERGRPARPMQTAMQAAFARAIERRGYS